MVSPIHNCTPRIEISNGNIWVYSDDSLTQWAYQFNFDSINSVCWINTGILILKNIFQTDFWFENYSTAWKYLLILKTISTLESIFWFWKLFSTAWKCLLIWKLFRQLDYYPYFKISRVFQQFDINEDSLFEIDGFFYQPDSASVVRFLCINPKCLRWIILFE
jgi:hypothetical protein